MSDVLISDLEDEIDDLQSQINSLTGNLNSVSNSHALVNSDTGTHYQSTYTYFYVPGSSTNSTTTIDDSGLGTILRLGEYADIEETAYNAGSGTYSAYYPAQHIADESGTAIYTNAAGGGKGILMACDGRILVKSGEKMYLNTTGNIHVQSAEGSVTVKSGTKAGTAQNIYIIAADGKGDLETTVYKDKRTVNGEQYENVTDVSRKYYTANKYEIYHSDQYKEVYGTTKSTQWGIDRKYFMGGTLSCKLAAEFAITLAVSVAVDPITKFSFYGMKLDCGFWKIDFVLGFKTEIKNGHIETSPFAFKSKAVEVKANATKAEAIPVKASTGGVTAEQIAAECANVSVKSMIALWEAKIASTAQI